MIQKRYTIYNLRVVDILQKKGKISIKGTQYDNVIDNLHTNHQLKHNLKYRNIISLYV